MLYTAYSFFVHPPKNIFNALRVPFTIPAPMLRAILVQHTQPPRETLPLPLENLLTRMASFEVRTFYVRCVIEARSGKIPALTFEGVV